MPPNDFLEALRTYPSDAEPVLTRVKRVTEKYASHRGELIDDALGNTIWGTIRWSRSLGWPDAARMADGFSVRFQYEEVDGVVGQTGGKKTNRICDGAPPILWDGPHDEENFRVSFLHFGPHQWGHLAIVELKPDVEWDGIVPWWRPPVRVLLYPATLANGIFVPKQVGPTFLDDFLVVDRYSTY